MKKLQSILFAIMLTGFSVILLSFTTFLQDKKKWVVPESAKKVTNPTKASEENITIAKNLFAKHCRSCHGKNGEGDGTKAAELKSFPGDFTTPKFQAQTDGEIFYKTTEGRDEMPEFKKKLPSDEDRWLIVHYLRTLKAN